MLADYSATHLVPMPCSVFEHAQEADDVDEHKRKPRAAFLAIPVRGAGQREDAPCRPPSVTSAVSAESGVFSLTCAEEDEEDHAAAGFTGQGAQAAALLIAADSCVSTGDSCGSGIPGSVWATDDEDLGAPGTFRGACADTGEALSLTSGRVGGSRHLNSDLLYSRHGFPCNSGDGASGGISPALADTLTEFNSLSQTHISPQSSNGIGRRTASPKPLVSAENHGCSTVEVPRQEGTQWFPDYRSMEVESAENTLTMGHRDMSIRDRGGTTFSGIVSDSEKQDSGDSQEFEDSQDSQDNQMSGDKVVVGDNQDSENSQGDQHSADSQHNGGNNDGCNGVNVNAGKSWRAWKCAVRESRAAAEADRSGKGRKQRGTTGPTVTCLACPSYRQLYDDYDASAEDSSTGGADVMGLDDIDVEEEEERQKDDAEIDSRREDAHVEVFCQRGQVVDNVERRNEVDAEEVENERRGEAKLSQMTPILFEENRDANISGVNSVQLDISPTLDSGKTTDASKPVNIQGERACATPRLHSGRCVPQPAPQSQASACSTSCTPIDTPGSPAVHVCQVCGNWYECSDLLLVHQAEHPFRRLHPSLRCGGCGAEFRFSGGLSRHLALNTDPRGFRCPRCQQQFRRCEDVYRHQQDRRYEQEGPASILAPDGFLRRARPRQWLHRY